MSPACHRSYESVVFRLGLRRARVPDYPHPRKNPDARPNPVQLRKFGFGAELRVLQKSGKVSNRPEM
jgi:hypothetical protein